VGTRVGIRQIYKRAAGPNRKHAQDSSENPEEEPTLSTQV
jgi:hypothetical protein